MKLIVFSGIALVMLLLVSSIPVSVYCQNIQDEEYGYTKLSGPRLGVTILTGEIAKKLKDDYDAVPVITQFGWQFETRFFTLEDGTAGLVEGIVLVGGVEQGLFLPSLSGLIGVRSKTGFEFGLGPNLSVTGFGLILAAGVNFSSDNINFPVNFAVLPSDKGLRFTILVGFNAKVRE